MTSIYLPAAIFTSLIVSVVTMSVLFYLRHLKIHVRESTCWALAFTCMAMRQGCSLLAVSGLPFFSFGIDFFVMAYACLLWAGVRIFSGVSVYVMPVMLIFAMAGLWLLMGHSTGLPFLWLTLPAYLFSGFLLFASGVTLWRTQKDVNYLVYRMLAVALLLKGLHLANFPFLRPLPWFAPYGYGIGFFLDMVAGMLFVVLLVLRQQDSTERVSQVLRQEILERKAAQQRSKERETLFEKIFQLVPDILLICRESDGRFLEVNRHWEEVTGYTREESLGRDSVQLNLWSDMELREKLIAAIRTKREVNNFEAVFLHKSGYTYHVLISGICFETGGESYVMYVTQDVTALRKAQHLQEQVTEELRQREKLLATVFQLVPDTLTITKMSTGEYVDVNRNWEPLTGYTREEVIGKTSASLNLWADYRQRDELVARIQQEGEVRNMQIGFRHRDQSISQCRVSGSLFNADDEVYLLLASKNIDQEIAVENARVVAENLRRENQQKYSMLFQSSPIPLGLMHVEDQKIVEVNDIWLKHFSLPYETTHDIFQALPGFWADGDQPAAMLDSLQAGNSIDQLEVLVRDKEGRHIICLMSARLLEMHNSLMCIFSLFDVTRQYQVEQEIREMTAQLEDRVRLRTIGLQQANVELASAMESLKITQDELIRSEKMAALGSLVAGVAHELNTPIGNSVTVASTLQDKTQELLADISAGKLRRSVLDQYLQSAEQGTSLLMRTLGVARELIGNFKQVAVDQASNQRRKFDLRHVLDEVLSTLAPMYKNGPFNLITDLEADIEMDSYPGPLGQIITNFMTNALNHAFEGRTEGQILIISRRSSTNSVEIVFEDNGVGIEEAEQKRVFDPFYTTKLGQGGSGLGMNIAYNLVTGVLGGEIRLFSQPGKGTRFTLDLPCIAPELAIEGE